MKVLVICGESVADAVFSTPLIRALKVQLDDAVVHVLVPGPSVFLFEENPYVDEVHATGLSFLKMYSLLKNARFDAVVNLCRGFVMSLLVRMLPTRLFSMQVDSWSRWLMVNLKIDKFQNIHETDRMLRSVESLGIRGDELGLDYFIPERDRVSVDWLGEPFQNGYVIFSISAQYGTRKLTVNRMIELCDKINKPIILLGTAGDAPAGDVISSFFARDDSAGWEEGLVELNKKTLVYNACGKFNFNQMASVVKQARGIFLFDDDFIPVASAFKKEVFCLLGNTILLFGRYPYRTKFTVLENNTISCRPCSSRGFNRCPKQHFKCMNDIVFDFYLP